MHLPDKYGYGFILIEALIFGFYGALGEFLLILNGIMVYAGGWTSAHAFAGYFAVWLLLFGAWSKVKKLNA